MVYILGTEHFYLPIFSPLHMNCWFISFVIAEYYLQISAEGQNSWGNVYLLPPPQLPSKYLNKTFLLILK